MFNTIIFSVSFIKDLKSLGMAFYIENPLLLISYVLESPVSMVLFLILLSNQYKIAWDEKRTGNNHAIVLTVFLIMIRFASEITFYIAKKILMEGQYSVQTYLLSYVSVFGMVQTVVFAFSIYYLINLIKLKKASADKL